jgi:hypothetical protein
MEISKGNSLCSFLYPKQSKMSLFSFSFYKVVEPERGTGPAQGGLVPVGGERLWRKYA